MKTIIVGCGKVGTSIINSLVKEKHDIVAIDKNPAVINEISNIYDIICVCGNGTDCEVLEEAGVDKAELFVAVTSSDEFNMLSCYLAEKMGARHTIARIRNPEYNDKSLTFMRNQLNLTTSVNPEFMAASEIYNILKLPAAANLESFSGRYLEMMEYRLKPESPLIGHTLSELRKKYISKFLICAVQRGDQVYIPDGNFTLQEGDRIGLTSSPAELQKFSKEIRSVNKQTHSVLILGASITTFYLCKKLAASGTSVKVIDKDEKKLHDLVAAIPEVVAICGDGAEQELLVEEGIDSVDAFVALTGIDEENILISIFANSRNVPKVIPKINRPELLKMASDLGLDSIVSPKKIVTDLICRYARALQNTVGSNIETLYKLMDGNVEALEFKVTSKFESVNIPIRDLTLKPGIIIAGIIRGKKAIIPSGEDTIQPGDNVVIIVSGQQVSTLSEIIQ